MAMRHSPSTRRFAREGFESSHTSGSRTPRPQPQYIETIWDVRDSNLQAQRHLQLRSSLHPHRHRLGERSGLRKALQDGREGPPLTRPRTSEGHGRLALGGPDCRRCCRTHADLGRPGRQTSRGCDLSTHAAPCPWRFNEHALGIAPISRRPIPRRGALQGRGNVEQGAGSSAGTA